MNGGGTLTNGSASSQATISGDTGVAFGSAAAATLTNYGTISGIKAGVSFANGADRLIAEPGSVIKGGALGGHGTLELAGGTGAITGMNGPGGKGGKVSGAVTMSFANFSNFILDAGGTWALSGNSHLDPSGGLTLAGTLTGLGTLNGAVTVAATGVIDADSGNFNTLGSITNGGLIETTGAGGLLIKSSFDNEGTLAALGGNITVTSAVTGAGSLIIDGATVSFGGSFSQNVTFSGTTGLLKLANSQGYGGMITGFSHGGGTRFDLLDIQYGASTRATFAGDTNSGLLTVTDGTHTASFTLAGDYTTSLFILADDGHGGTMVKDPPAGSSPSAQGFAAAMAGLGSSSASGAASSPTSFSGPFVTPLSSPGPG
jgi:hypothetical protein